MWLRRSEETPTRRIPAILAETLNHLDQDAVILAPGEISIFSTEGVDKLGLLKDGKIQSPELIALIRVVRRNSQTQTGKISIPRGPIGEGARDLTVRVIDLKENNQILVLLSDESEAERVHQVRRDFVANISHELKTPIGALSLLSEAVLSAKDDPEAVTKFATRMQHEARRLTDLVQEIINLSRLQDSDPLLVAEEVNINDIIQVAVDQCQTISQARNIDVTFTRGAETSVLGDSEQITMAIHNLVENAINYSPENTKVSVSTIIENGIVQISVTDQGIGIPESDQTRIFERFYRVDPARSRETGGTGLGLSIVKHVATKHGGDVSVWSAPAVGSTFALRLPIYSNAEEVQL